MQKNYRFSKKQEGTVLKHPPYGGWEFNTSFHKLHQWLRMAVKISLAFSKLILDVKVEFLLISWHFLVVFWFRFPTRPFIDTLIFVTLKVFS